MMRLLTAVAVACLATPALSQTPAQPGSEPLVTGWALYVEEDMFLDPYIGGLNSDRNYTGGLGIQLNGRISAATMGQPLSLLDRAVGLLGIPVHREHRGAERYQHSIMLTGVAFTPGSLNKPVPQPEDRPFSSLIALSGRIPASTRQGQHPVLPAEAGAQRRTRGTASLVWTTNSLSASDSAWTRDSQRGVALRLGYLAFEWPRRVEVVPHAQIGATSVGGVDEGAAYALADGEFGVQVRYRVTDRVRPYATGRYPIWHTVEVERGTERRDYALSGGSKQPTWGGGIEIALFDTGAGLDVGFSRAAGESGLLEVFDAAGSFEAGTRFWSDTISEPYSVWRIYIGYSGPFSLVDPIPRPLRGW